MFCAQRRDFHQMQIYIQKERKVSSDLGQLAGYTLGGSYFAYKISLSFLNENLSLRLQN